VSRLLGQMKKLVIDYDGLSRNIRMTGGLFLAEPLYILLASRGVGDAHTLVKEATLKAEREGATVFDVMEQDETFREIVELDVWKKLKENPAHYTGKAAQRARGISSYWRKQLNEMERACDTHRTVPYE